jgi:hypothetical protein
MKLSSVTAGAFATLLFTQSGCTPVNNWYEDSDGDGFGNPLVYDSSSTTQPAGYVSIAGDCNDNNIAINPDAEEIADELDNNCNGLVDEGLTPVAWYRDTDTDGYGDATNSLSAISQPDGYVSDDSDCDDTNAAINPDASEVFDSIDNNCNGEVDEGFSPSTWYFDNDEDSYGDVNTTTEAVEAPAGYVNDSSDCNDNDSAINPGVTEAFDGLDNNCNGEVDEGFSPSTWYFDGDADGFGDASDTTLDITQPLNYVSNDSDCDDSDSAVNPDATEAFDSIDNNCNGEIDEGFFASTWYRDSDEDNYGTADITTSAVLQPAGYVSNDSDCDDSSAAVNPDAVEVADDIDNNCNGEIDEGFNTYYRDNDSDTFGDASDSLEALTQPAGYVSDASDCNDSDATIYPGAAELADGKDNNCDGSIDEGLAPPAPTGLAEKSSGWDWGKATTFAEFSWNGVANADAYEIYMDGQGGCYGDKSATFGNTTTGKLTGSPLCRGSNYLVKIKARRDGIWSAWSSNITMKID